MRLTEHAHRHLGEVLGPGAIAVDATLGNGHDALFLAQRVGETGHVYGLDVQPEAIRNSRRRLAAAGLLPRVTLIQAGHERLAAELPGPCRVQAVTFNLGYLPGGDRRRTTRPETTSAALEQAADRLAPGGRLSVIAYRGHPGGEEECAAVARWAEGLPGAGFALEVVRSPGPVLYLLSRRA